MPSSSTHMDDKIFKNLVNTDRHTITLTYSILSDDQFDEIIRCLEYDRLQDLTLYGIEVDDLRIEKLAEALVHNSSLQILNLWNNGIGDDGVKKLADTLEHNFSLQSLLLWNNQIGNVGIEKLAEALKLNHSLKNLDLRHNTLSQISMNTLIETLNVNPFITVKVHDNVEIDRLCSEEGRRIRMAQYKRFKYTKSPKNCL